MGRGFWILDNITSLRDDVMASQGDAAHLFQPDRTIRYRYPKIRSGNSFPEYPRTAVYIDYYLPEAIEGLQLEILDSNQKPVVTIVSDSTLLKTSVEEEENMDLSTTFRYVNEKLEAKKGLNRFGWDLREKGPWHKEEKKRFKNGPMVLPGRYSAKLTVGDKSWTQDFEVVPDPRVQAEGITMEILQKQHEMQRNVMLLLSEARQLQERLEKESKELEAQEGEGDTGRLETVTAAIEQLKNAEGAYPQQMLVAQISYLYNMVTGADQIIGQDVLERYDELRRLLTAIKNKVQ